MTDDPTERRLRQSIADEASERLADQGMSEEEAERHKELMADLRNELLRQHYEL